MVYNIHEKGELWTTMCGYHKKFFLSRIWVRLYYTIQGVSKNPGICDFLSDQNKRKFCIIFNSPIHVY